MKLCADFDKVIFSVNVEKHDTGPTLVFRMFYCYPLHPSVPFPVRFSVCLVVFPSVCMSSQFSAVQFYALLIFQAVRTGFSLFHERKRRYRQSLLYRFPSAISQFTGGFYSHSSVTLQMSIYTINLACVLLRVTGT